jgi:DNA-directed RNA polymerase subunit RPC12/RpoP
VSVPGGNVPPAPGPPPVPPQQGQGWPQQPAPQPPAPPAPPNQGQGWPQQPAPQQPAPQAPAAPPPGGAVEQNPHHAVLHTTEQTRTYPCGTCGGNMEFHIGQQLLVCPHCGNQQQLVENTGGTVEERDFRQAVAALRTDAAHRSVQQVPDEWVVVCQSCGGNTTFTGTLTATRCPYCATPIQRDDVHQAPARLAVDGVLPFAVDQTAARQHIDKWIKSRWFAPSEFKKYNRTGSFASVYMAYFTYDAETTTDYDGRRGDNYTVQVGSGDNRRTETRVRWSHRSGRVRNRFDDIAVCANEGLDRRHVTALEPWPTQAARPFSAEYVAGHLCRTYDHGVEESFGQAEQRIDKEIQHTVRRDIGGDRQDINRMDTHYDRLTFKHLLLPIWLLTVIFQGRPFQVMINGVTGEVRGQRPWSVAKIAAAAVVVAILVAVAVILLA